MKLTHLLKLKSNVKDMYKDLEDHILEKGFLLDAKDQKILDTFEDMMELIDEQIGRREYSKVYNKTRRKPEEKKTKNRLLMGLWK